MIPLWGMVRAMTLADPMEKSSSRVSIVSSSPRNCSMWIGKTGGCTAACRASFRLPLRLRRAVHGEAGPGIMQGAEEGQAEDVVEMEMGQEGGGMQRGPQSPHLLCSTSPSARSPVPRSTMRGSSPSMLTTRHEVFPPYRR